MSNDGGLNNSEEEQILTALSAPAIRIDERLYVMSVNRAFEAAFGWTLAEIKDTLFPGGAELPNLKENFGRSSSDLNRTHKRTLRHRDGGPIHALISGSQLHDDANGNAVFLLVFVSVNEQVLTERFLLRDQQFLRILLDHVPHPIFVKNEPDGQFVYWNKACEVLFGLKTADVLGRTDYDFFGVEEARAFREKDKEVFRGGRTVIVPEEVVTSLTVGRRILRTSKTPIFDEIGTPLMLIGISEDITERKAEEEKIRRLATAVHQVSEAIMITDTDRAILYVNPAFESMSGFDSSEVIGKAPSILHDPKGGHDLLEKISAKVLEGSVWKGKATIQRMDGKVCETESTVSPVRDSDGAIRYFVTVARDITQMLMLEAQLRQAQKLESVGSLAAGIAHEINTPIQFIGDNLNFLSDSFEQIEKILRLSQQMSQCPELEDVKVMSRQLEAQLSDANIDMLISDIPEAVTQSLQGVQRVADIVRAMKAFSHPDTRDKSQVDINAALQTTLVVARNEIKYVAKVETNLAPDLPPVQGYAGELNQVFLNLLVNAAHAIGDVVKKNEGGQGTIAVKTWFANEAVHIAISDTGTGIDAKIKDRIFDPFFTTKGVGKGTGQGLAIARSAIVDKHGGKIWCESEVGKGSTFYIDLPVAPVAASEMILG
ncbi:MAG: PAS domain S-box protein [Candidatus Zixiibacteriota bacterium]